MTTKVEKHSFEEHHFILITGPQGEVEATLNGLVDSNTGRYMVIERQMLGANEFEMLVKHLRPAKAQAKNLRYWSDALNTYVSIPED